MEFVNSVHFPIDGRGNSVFLVTVTNKCFSVYRSSNVVELNTWPIDAVNNKDKEYLKTFYRCVYRRRRYENL